ncbi:MAG: ABC transporter permease [Firmicutes bacterium]|nr:ABC transporter permease [Bacillota bacterium]
MLPGDSAEPVVSHVGRLTALVTAFLQKTLTMAELEIRKLWHDPTELFTRAAQPILWLLVFGQVFSRTRAIPTGELRYLDFMAPGILAQSVLFISIFYGIAIIWERDLGLVHKFLVTPTPRTALVLGKALSAGIRGLSQAVIIYLLAVLLGVKVDLRPLALLGVAVTIFLAGGVFSTFSLIVACLVKTRDRFIGIGQLLTMPLFFASNDIYPLSLMPEWLRAIAKINPLTYTVDALRALMLYGVNPGAHSLALELVVLTGVMAVLVTIGGKLYPRVVV